jgi:hypothetical protein
MRIWSLRYVWEVLLEEIGSRIELLLQLMREVQKMETHSIIKSMNLIMFLAYIIFILFIVLIIDIVLITLSFWTFHYLLLRRTKLLKMRSNWTDRSSKDDNSR